MHSPLVSRALRLARRAAIAAVAAVVVVGLAGLPIYVFPPSSVPASADLIYIIGPPTKERIAEAEQLRADGVAERVLVSVPRKGADSASRLGYCHRSYVTCETPDPFTTRGEAAMLSAYATPDENVIVLTYTPHVARTRYIFGMCSTSPVEVVAVSEKMPLDRWIYNYAYQSAAFVKAWMLGCAPAAAPGDAG